MSYAAVHRSFNIRTAQMLIQTSRSSTSETCSTSNLIAFKIQATVDSEIGTKTPRAQFFSLHSDKRFIHQTNLNAYCGGSEQFPLPTSSGSSTHIVSRPQSALPPRKHMDVKRNFPRCSSANDCRFHPFPAKGRNQEIYPRRMPAS